MPKTMKFPMIMSTAKGIQPKIGSINEPNKNVNMYLNSRENSINPNDLNVWMYPVVSIETKQEIVTKSVT